MSTQFVRLPPVIYRIRLAFTVLITVGIVANTWRIYCAGLPQFEPSSPRLPDHLRRSVQLRYGMSEIEVTTVMGQAPSLTEEQPLEKAGLSGPVWTYNIRGDAVILQFNGSRRLADLREQYGGKTASDKSHPFFATVPTTKQISNSPY